AEKLLLLVVAKDSSASAAEQKEASYQLAKIYARTSRPQHAIAQIESLLERYSRDSRVVEFLFLKASSYRQLAGQDVHLVSVSPADAKAAADVQAGRQENLLKAKGVFDQIVARDGGADLRDADKTCIKLANL